MERYCFIFLVTIAIVSAAVAATAAMADAATNPSPTPSASPEQQAMGQTIVACVQNEVALRAQVINMTNERDALQAKLDALKPTEAKPTAPSP